jgi:hypothetical protein
VNRSSIRAQDDPFGRAVQPLIEKRCVQDMAYRVITGGLCPDRATIARFRHEQALGGLFSQVLRLLAAEGMVSLRVRAAARSRL